MTNVEREKKWVTSVKESNTHEGCKSETANGCLAKPFSCPRQSHSVALYGQVGQLLFKEPLKLQFMFGPKIEHMGITY